MTNEESQSPESGVPADDDAERNADIERPRAALRELVEHERERHPLVIGLVAPLAVDLDSVQKTLEQGLEAFRYETVRVRLSNLFDTSPYRPWGNQLPSKGEKNYIRLHMDAGDRLRSDAESGAALAALAVARIAQLRSELDDEVVFLLRSLKHPDEVSLLRHVYGDAFFLLAVVTSEQERRENLTSSLSLFEDPRAEAERLIARDEADPEDKEFGQNVRDVYELADAFILNERGQSAEPDIERFLDCIFGAPFTSPQQDEEGMRFAYDASLRSAAMGRQVGAALIPRVGTPVVAGTNEVSKPGGGQYWAGDTPDYRDFQTGVDPNPFYTERVLQEVLERLRDAGWLRGDFDSVSGSELLRRATRNPDDGDVTAEGGNRSDEDGPPMVGARASSLIEFTRCLHAEQAAIINAARSGVSTEEAVLYSTTFPCHECAKLIVGAGVIEVHYIEPYPKSLVGRLFRDLIETAPPPGAIKGLINGKVPFKPFVGIAPRLYERAFKAGKRREGSQAIEFKRREACPRTSGWNEAQVAQRESVTVSSISRILQVLATTGKEEGVDEGESPSQVENAERPGESPDEASASTTA